MTHVNIQKTIEEFYKEGVQDEYLVMNIVEQCLGGKTFKANEEDDKYRHIDFFWESPKKGLIGIDVKGIKKNNRNDKKKDDSINWIELQGVTGYPGWVYGEAEYIAFRTYTDIIFVKREVLVEFAEKTVKNKDIVYKCPKELYVPYQRYGRQDKVFKCSTEDLRKLSENKGFILKNK